MTNREHAAKAQLDQMDYEYLSQKTQLDAIAKVRAGLPLVKSNRHRALDAYFSQKRAELQAIKPPAVICSKESILSVDEDGTAFIKPPRSMHRSRIVRLLDRVTRWLDPQA